MKILIPEADLVNFWMNTNLVTAFLLPFLWVLFFFASYRSNLKQKNRKSSKQFRSGAFHAAKEETKFYAIISVVALFVSIPVCQIVFIILGIFCGLLCIVDLEFGVKLFVCLLAPSVVLVSCGVQILVVKLSWKFE
jgi:hypothetical protein